VTARRLAPAVGRLARELRLGPQGEVLAAQARHLAAMIDRGELPPYAVPAAHRELRATVEALVAAPGAEGGGITDAELEALLSGPV
jgi:hypothetical protein